MAVSDLFDLAHDQRQGTGARLKSIPPYNKLYMVFGQEPDSAIILAKRGLIFKNPSRPSTVVKLICLMDIGSFLFSAAHKHQTDV